MHSIVSEHVASAPAGATHGWPTWPPGPLTRGMAHTRMWGRRYGDIMFTAVTALAMLVAIYAALVFGPLAPSYVALGVGLLWRIFYFHVPIAWCAYLAFGVVCVASVAYLWRGDTRWDWLARASAEVGVVFTTLTLISGSIWGEPMWGAWWVWDARLTTTLILWFVYVGYMLLRFYMGHRTRGARAAAVLGIVGFVDVPINYFSVTWWHGLHPVYIELTRAGLQNTGQLPGAAITTLMICLSAFTLLYAYLLLQVYRLEKMRDEIGSLRARVEREADLD